MKSSTFHYVYTSTLGDDTDCYTLYPNYNMTIQEFIQYAIKSFNRGVIDIAEGKSVKHLCLYEDKQMIKDTTELKEYRFKYNNYFIERIFANMGYGIGNFIITIKN